MNLFALENFPDIHLEPNQLQHYLRINQENALVGTDELKALAHGAHLLYSVITIYLSACNKVSED